MEAEEFLRLVTGDLCPCGHNASEHAEPSEEDTIMPGMVEKMGSCTKCNCAGVLELKELHDDCF